jgi:hypothetical protein
MLGSRFNGVVSVSLIFLLLRNGVDVNSFLESWGVSGDTGSYLGTWAAAVVLNSAFFPISSYLSIAHVAPALARALPKSWQKVESEDDESKEKPKSS